MRLTQKQRQIMGVLVQGWYDEKARCVKWFDIDQLIERVPYTVNKRPMQVSLDVLESRGFIKTVYECRRAKRRRVLEPTKFGLSVFRPVMDSDQKTDSELVPGQSPESLFSSEEFVGLDALL
jgi:hypothetical protein